MPFEKEEFKFPDEIENKTVEKDDDIEIEIEDDTPEEDRGRKPSDPKFVEELDKDELDEYSAQAKQKIAGYKKVWHDERRAKEAADREREEAVALAQRLFDENRALKGQVKNTEGFALGSFKQRASTELQMARKAYREAYESGDTDKLIEAQEAITEAKMTLARAEQAEENFKNTPVQEEQFVVQTTQPQRKTAPRDTKAEDWRERNPWFDTDPEMRSLALGLHEKLISEHGAAYATTDEYYKRIDATVRKRFPENFEDADTEVEVSSKPPTRSKPSLVVAPASRSTSSKKLKLKTSQLNIARKLGLTPEQYAKEVLKLEV
jgi:hypothetical protein